MVFSYYFLDEQSQQQGPITADRFAEFGVQPNTLVWREGMRSWMAAISLPELQPIFRGDNFNSQSAGYNNGYQQAAPNYNVPPLPPRPISHLVWVGICALLCFGCIFLLPFVIVGILKSIESEKKYGLGLYTEATEAAQKAKKWSLIGIVTFVVIISVFFILSIVSTISLFSLINSYTTIF